MRETRKLLVRNEKANKLGDNIQIAFRQPKNLKNLVTGFPHGLGGREQPNKMPAVQNARSATPAKF